MLPCCIFSQTIMWVNTSLVNCNSVSIYFVTLFLLCANNDCRLDLTKQSLGGQCMLRVFYKLVLVVCVGEGSSLLCLQTTTCVCPCTVSTRLPLPTFILRSHPSPALHCGFLVLLLYRYLCSFPIVFFSS